MIPWGVPPWIGNLHIGSLIKVRVTNNHGPSASPMTFATSPLVGCGGYWIFQNLLHPTNSFFRILFVLIRMIRTGKNDGKPQFFPYCSHQFCPGGEGATSVHLNQSHPTDRRVSPFAASELVGKACGLLVAFPAVSLQFWEDQNRGPTNLVE